MARPLIGPADLLALCIALIWALAGCSTDCADAAGKLDFCELPIPGTLGGECDDETALACQARCVRDTGCEQLSQSMAGQSTDFERCAEACGGETLFASFGAQGGGGKGGQSAAGGGGAAEQ